jgi:hypothetical protein
MQKIMDIRPQAPFKLRVASARDFGLFTRFASRRLQYLPAVVELKLEEYDFDPNVPINYEELTAEADIASLLPLTLKFAHIPSLPSKYDFDISHCTRLEQLYIESGEVPKVAIRFPDSLRMLTFSHSLDHTSLTWAWTFSHRDLLRCMLEATIRIRFCHFHLP